MVAVNEAKDRAEKIKAVLAYKKKAGASMDDLNEGLVELCETMAGGGTVLRTVPREPGQRTDITSGMDAPPTGARDIGFRPARQQRLTAEDG